MKTIEPLFYQETFDRPKINRLLKLFPLRIPRKKKKKMRRDLTRVVDKAVKTQIALRDKIDSAVIQRMKDSLTNAIVNHIHK